jgi:hypothetical protein
VSWVARPSSVLPSVLLLHSVAAPFRQHRATPSRSRRISGQSPSLPDVNCQEPTRQSRTGFEQKTGEPVSRRFAHFGREVLKILDRVPNSNNSFALHSESLRAFGPSVRLALGGRKSHRCDANCAPEVAERQDYGSVSRRGNADCLFSGVGASSTAPRPSLSSARSTQKMIAPSGVINPRTAQLRMKATIRWRNSRVRGGADQDESTPRRTRHDLRGVNSDRQKRQPMKKPDARSLSGTGARSVHGR